MREISELVRVVYVRQKKALGLGHAILQAEQVVGDEPFAVFLGDSVIDSTESAVDQMLTVQQRYGKSVIGVHRPPREQLSSFGVIEPTAGPAGQTSRCTG
ncbi:MAG: sugar phosphate nucleotidyltransferase [Candidatus Andersenbacteria bacterium]